MYSLPPSPLRPAGLRAERCWTLRVTRDRGAQNHINRGVGVPSCVSPPAQLCPPRQDARDGAAAASGLCPLPGGASCYGAFP